MLFLELRAKLMWHMCKALASKQTLCRVIPDADAE